MVLPAFGEEFGCPVVRYTVAVSVKNLGLEVSKERVCFCPSRALCTQFGVIVGKALGEVDGAGSGAARRGLEFLVVAGQEKLSFVDPEKDRAGVLFGVSLLDRPLPDIFPQGLGSRAEVVILLLRQIKKDDLAFLGEFRC